MPDLETLSHKSVRMLGASAFLCTVVAVACGTGERRALTESTVPFELVDNRVFVEAKLNGQGPFHVLLDTGARATGRSGPR
jgi:hypothetical protein